MKPRNNAYALSALSSGAGALIVGRIGVAVGQRYAELYMPYAEIGGLVPPLLGAGLGAWLGAILGCWAAIVLAKSGALKGTLIRLAIAVPLALITWIAIVTSLNGFLASFPSAIWVGAVAWVSLAGTLARWLALPRL